MKIFKTVVLILMTVSTSQTGYFALLYKVEIATGTFLIYIDFTSFVETDGASITSAGFKMTLTSCKGGFYLLNEALV